MATTIVLDTSLDVVNKYRELVEEITTEGSLYIKMKETLLDLLDSGDIKGPDKAKVIAETIAQMSASLSGQAMQSALAWTAQEKELYLKKAELEVRLEALANETLKITKDIEVSDEAKKMAQAKRIREYGVATLDTKGNVTSLTDAGLVYQQQLLVEKQIAQGTAAITKAADDLLTSAKQRASIEKQTELYQRQKEGFDDNKYQKLFESQINAWGLMFSSGLMPDKPGIIRDDKVSELYTTLTAPSYTLSPTSSGSLHLIEYGSTKSLDGTINGTEAATSTTFRVSLPTNTVVTDVASLTLNDVVFKTKNITSTNVTNKYIDFVVAPNELGSDGTAKVIVAVLKDSSGRIIGNTSNPITFVLNALA